MINKNKAYRNIHYAWVILIVAFLVLSIYVPVVNSLTNIWQIAVINDLGFSRTEFSLSTTITQAIGIFIAPLASYLLSKYNFKFIWTISALFFSLAVFSYSLATNKYHFYILAFFVGFSYIITAQIPMMMLINNWFYKKRGIAISIAVSGISAGGALLSPIISIIINNFGWRISYRIYAILIFIIAIFFGIFLIYLNPEDRGMRAYGYEASYNSDYEYSKNAFNCLNINLSISKSIVYSFFVFLILGAIINGLANGATLQFLPELQETIGFKNAGTVVSIYLLLGVFTKLLLGKIADKYGIYPAIFFSTMSLILSFVAILFIKYAYGSLIFAVIFGFGLALGSVLPPIIVSSIYDKKNYGKVYAFIQSGIQIGAAFGPLLVSYIFDISGKYTFAWIINIFLSSLIGIFWFLAHNKAKKYTQYSKE